MKPNKLHILLWFLRLRISRYLSSNRVNSSRKQFWKKTLSNSAFYRKLVDTEAFPIMNKQSFMEHFDEINTVGITKSQAMQVALESEQSRDFTPSIGNISVGLSSGTSGNKGIFLTSSREKEIWVGAILDRVIGLSFRKRKVAFFLRANNNLYESVKSKTLEFTFFDLKDSFNVHFDRLTALAPDILVAQPSALNQIAQGYQETGTKPSFTKVVSVAEVLEEDQKAYFQQIFQCRIDQVYQCTEGFLAYTCKKGKLHFNEDWLRIEKRYLDESRFHPIITDYLRSSQPIVRYELNDIIHEGKPCTCGSKSTVIDRIEGRSDDVFHFEVNNENVLVYPDFIRRAVISSSDEIRNYFVRQTSKSRLEVSLELSNQVSSKEAFDSVKSQLTNVLQQFGVTNIEITPMQYQHNPMMKFTRIKNECRETV